MKTTLTLLPVNGGPFSCLPAREVELEDERIMCNNVILPGEFNAHNVRLFVIGHEFGAVGAVWAECEQEAFDELVDAGLGEAFLVPEKDQDEASDEERAEWAHLGNAGEPCDLTNAWIQFVRLDGPRDWQLIAAFAEARGAGHDSLCK